MMKKSPPFVPGSDVCGIVIAAGEDAKEYDVAIGDMVFGVSQSGAMSEYALMLLENTYKVPKGVDPAIAAGFEMNYGTTYHGLVDLGNLVEGETLLVLGASGGVGMAAIDIGKGMIDIFARSSTQRSTHTHHTIYKRWEPESLLARLLQKSWKCVDLREQTF